jgi:aldose 1-epimerase
VVATPLPPSGGQIDLTHGDQRVVVVEVGGGLRSYSAGGRDVLDGYGPAEMCRSGRGQVLSPWPNRLQDGSYEFGGRRHQLPLTEPEHRNAIHGLVRWEAWTVTERDPHRVVLRHVVHPRPGYPFSLVLQMDYQLSDAGLLVRSTATNAGAEPCPYGSGAHPYLTLGTATVDPVVLRVPARTVLHTDDRGIPVGAEPVDGSDYDFRRPRPIGATVLDHAFTDLERDEDGLARVELSGPDGARVVLWADAGYGYLMVFSGDPLPDVNRRSLAVEPMTCPPNAFRSGQDLICLEPGRSFTSTWGIDPTGGRP